MKKVAFVTMCLVLFSISFVIVMVFHRGQTTSHSAVSPTPAFSPQPITFQSTLPAQSLSGTVVELKGGIVKTVRGEKDSQLADEKSLFLEDEQLIASLSGSIDIRFAQRDLFSVSPNTVLTFASTNPQHFLVKQDKGVVIYQTDELIATISARSMHALFSLSQGKATLTVNPDKKLIDFFVENGTGQIGYLDTHNLTQVFPVTFGQTVRFDDQKRTVKLSP